MGCVECVRDVLFHLMTAGSGWRTMISLAVARRRLGAETENVLP